MNENDPEVFDMNKSDLLAILELIEISVEKCQTKEEALEVIRRTKESIKKPQ